MFNNKNIQEKNVMKFSNFQQNFSYIVGVTLIGGGNRSTGSKPPTCRKPLTNVASSAPRYDWDSNSQLHHVMR
jgi:hypothetical protein